MPDHRWSGWPGAWCLDCGAADQREVCLAENCPHALVLCGRARAVPGA